MIDVDEIWDMCIKNEYLWKYKTCVRRVVSSSHKYPCLCVIPMCSIVYISGVR